MVTVVAAIMWISASGGDLPGSYSYQAPYASLDRCERDRARLELWARERGAWRVESKCRPTTVRETE